MWTLYILVLLLVICDNEYSEELCYNYLKEFSDNYKKGFIDPLFNIDEYLFTIFSKNNNNHKTINNSKKSINNMKTTSMHSINNNQKDNTINKKLVDEDKISLENINNCNNESLPNTKKIIKNNLYIISSIVIFTFTILLIPFIYIVK